MLKKRLPDSALRYGDAAGASKPTRTRFLILALISGGTMINYLDRSVMGIAAPSITADLGINAAMMGLIFSAFSWTYALAQIPGGILLDRFGSKLVYWAALTLWSLCTGLQGLAQNFMTLLGIRLFVGAAEAPCFPSNSRVVATWFPQRERARATGVYTFAEYVGLAFLSPALFWILDRFGWRILLFSVALLGVLYGIVWLRAFHEPHESPSANQAELDLIEAGGGVVTAARSATSFQWAHIASLLRHRSLLGICLAQFACNATNVFFLTWFPTYLVQARHMPWLKVGWAAVLPFIAASVGTVFAGFISDVLLRRGISLNWARKGPVVAGLLGSSVIIAANFVSSNGAVIAILCMAYFFQGFSALGWSIVSDMAPEGFLGLTAAIFNLFANAAGIVIPLVVGIIVATTGSFVWALCFVSIITLLGALSYLVMVGDIRRLPSPYPTSEI